MGGGSLDPSLQETHGLFLKKYFQVLHACHSLLISRDLNNLKERRPLVKQQMVHYMYLRSYQWGRKTAYWLWVLFTGRNQLKAAPPAQPATPLRRSPLSGLGTYSL